MNRKNQKCLLDRKSPIQVRIHFPPAESLVRTSIFDQRSQVLFGKFAKLVGNGGPKAPLAPSPRMPAGMQSGRPWSSGSPSANTTAWSGCRGGCFNGSYRRRPPPSGASKPTISREPASSASPSGSYVGAIDRARERRDRRAGFAIGARTRRSPGPKPLQPTHRGTRLIEIPHH